MPFTKEFEFPSDEELTTTEVNISLSALRAGAIHFGKYCERENNEFMLCREEEQDPRKCLKEGKDVTNCAWRFFCNVKKHCSQEFEQYRNCLNKSSPDMNYSFCKNTQAVFDKCVLDKMGLERPHFGWQAEAHFHYTKRPKPKEEITYYTDVPDKLPDEKVKHPDPKFGVRFME